MTTPKASPAGRLSPQARGVLRDLGAVLHLPAGLVVLTLPVCVAAAEFRLLGPLLGMAALSLVAGQLLYRGFRQEQRTEQVRHAMLSAVAAWLIVPLISAPLLWLIGLLVDPAGPGSAAAVFREPWNALFETVSGFTGTGLSVVERPADLPATVQWWRSLMQWVGGVGVIVLMLTVFHPSGDVYRLYFAEARVEVFARDVRSTVRDIWWIYAGYTVVAVVVLRITGMTWWQALNHGMTGLATGGFAVTDHGLGDFGIAPRIAMMVIMVVGAISFAVHYHALVERTPWTLWRRPECRLLLALLAGGGLALALENAWYAGEMHGLDAAFQWTSALTTAGFGTVPIDSWSPTAHLLLVLAMICGGAAGSTAGGLKLNRVLLLGEAVLARLRGIILHPWRLMLHRPIAEPAAPEAVRLLEAAAILLVLWVITIVAASVVLLHVAGLSVRLEAVVLEVASALGNVGLSSGITGPELAWPGKLTLIVVMWLGRLEIVPTLVLLGALVVPPRRRGPR